MATAVQPRLVTVFGGSGFVGRYLVGALARRGYRVRVAVRRPDLTNHLNTLGKVGQIQPIQANLRFEDSVIRAVEGSDHVVNLVGILAESGAQSFESVQEQGAKFVAAASRDAGAGLTQISAIGASDESESIYARTKGRAEKAVLEIDSSAVIMRPSIIFGPEDEFFNRFAAMARLSPFLPAIGGGRTLFQPVYVGDVAEALALSVDGLATPGTIYELGGPEVLTFRQCMEEMLDVIDRKRFFLPVPFFAAELMGAVTGVLPGAPLTRDQVKLLRSDNVVSQTAIDEKRTLKGLGITPTGMEAILPSYLVRFRAQGQFGGRNRI